MSAAQDIIGEQAPDDYILRPEAHAQALPAEAGPLKRILALPTIQATIHQYRAADTRAARHQRIYKLFGRFAISLQAVAALTGAAFILDKPLNQAINWLAAGDGERAEWIAHRLTDIELAFVLIATFAGGLVTWLASFQKWNESRAAAELARINFFSQVLTGDNAPEGRELPLLPLQIEYFRRYQLQIQIAYYGTRGAQHERRYKNQFWTIIGLALISLTFLLAPYLSFSSGLWTAFKDCVTANNAGTFVGVAVATLTTMLANLSLLSQDEANARRYHSTLTNLRTLEREYLEPAREAAAKGERDRVLSFVAAVNDQISLEHRQWIFLHEIANQPDVGPLGLVRRPNLSRQPG